ncbi:MAG: hypothetical protein DWP95_03395 [Proteobacteria bacterium]|nr:MAG: hypothetical protein DWP95_03395 [Pseudomonadota bacterium]
MIVLSTTSPQDLTQYNTDLLTFERELTSLAIDNELTYPERWFVGSKHGCSCGFRNLSTSSIDLGFGVPEDWYPEETDDIEATIEFYLVIKKLLSEAHQVDCIDAWDNQDDQSSLLGTTVVNMNSVEPNEFRFFENHKFEFVT